ncbi:hypothetical protein D3C73_917790 [compost metagenome]
MHADPVEGFFRIAAIGQVGGQAAHHGLPGAEQVQIFDLGERRVRLLRADDPGHALFIDLIARLTQLLLPHAGGKGAEPAEGQETGGAKEKRGILLRHDSAQVDNETGQCKARDAQYHKEIDKELAMPKRLDQFACRGLRVLRCHVLPHPVVESGPLLDAGGVPAEDRAGIVKEPARSI